jgi:hypothetical protein
MKKFSWFIFLFICGVYGVLLFDNLVAQDEVLPAQPRVWLQDPMNQEVEDQGLYLTFNYQNGAVLELSNGATYAIAKRDQLYTAYWITPFFVQLDQSHDPDFPVRITNLTTGTSVDARPISKEEILNLPEGNQEIPPPQTPPTAPQSPTPQKK